MFDGILHQNTKFHKLKDNFIILYIYQMISFCQDLSISYEYHIYENKTIKKIIHKRNGSNISEKTMVKASKLSVVSKNIEQLQLANKPNKLKQVPHVQVIQSSEAIKTNHKRSFSNYVEQRINNDPSQKMLACHVTNREFNVFQTNKVRSIQCNQPILKPRVSFNQNLQNNYANETNKFHNLTGHVYPCSPSSYSKLQQTVTNRKNIPFQNTERLSSRTIKFKQSIQKLNQSIETKNYEQHYSKLHSRNNHSHSNSFASNQTISKMNSKNMASSLFHEDLASKNQFSQQFQFSFFTPRQTSFKNTFEKPKFFNPQKNDSFSISRESQLIRPIQSERKIIIPTINFQLKKYSIHSQNSLFDAKSIISNDLEEYQDEECTSVVQQRNFFFQKQEHPEKLFKRSIDKFLFFEPGYISQKRKWILFKNVQEKQNKKMYSIKQFSIQNEIQYFNEYDIYLTLKGQTSHFMCQRKRNNYFLNLFNALSNNSEKKLYLVKDSFDYLLNDYIDHLKKDNSMQIQRRMLLQSYRQKMKSQIEETFEFFSLKGIDIGSNEDLQIEDFIVSQAETGKKSIKFHSLQKLERFQNESTKFYKFNTFQKDKQNTSIHNEDVKKQNLNRKKIESLCQKINNAFFFQ